MNDDHVGFAEASELGRSAFFLGTIILLIVLLAMLPAPFDVWRLVGVIGTVLLLLAPLLHGYEFCIDEVERRITITDRWAWFIDGRTRAYDICRIAEIRRIPDDADELLQIVFDDGKRFNLYAFQHRRCLVESLRRVRPEVVAQFVTEYDRWWR